MKKFLLFAMFAFTVAGAVAQQTEIYLMVFISGLLNT